VKPYSEAANSDIRVEFAARQKKLITAIVVAIGVVLLVAATRHPANPLPVHAPAAAVKGLAMIAALALAVYSLFNWRCPACARYLGRAIAPRACPACGVPLRGD
jgi:protein-S-isoprenylcysteine O-methyltransferase Ste14